MSASECKPSPRSILGDEPSTLKFRALLNEGAAECFELTRAWKKEVRLASQLRFRALVSNGTSDDRFVCT
jgi:hypothetical protein